MPCPTLVPFAFHRRRSNFAVKRGEDRHFDRCVARHRRPGWPGLFVRNERADEECVALFQPSSCPFEPVPHCFHRKNRVLRVPPFPFHLRVRSELCSFASFRDAQGEERTNPEEPLSQSFPQGRGGSCLPFYSPTRREGIVPFDRGYGPPRTLLQGLS